MVYSKTFSAIINELETKNIEDIPLLGKFIQFGINLVQSTEELKEELLDYDNIYQVHVNDIDLDFWFKIYKGSFTYRKGINDNSTLKIIFTRQLMLKIIKGEITFTEAYLKGLIEMHGNLSQAVKIRNLINFYVRYLKKTFNLDK